MSDIEGKAARPDFRVGGMSGRTKAASEWSRGDASDIDGQAGRPNGREHMSQRGQRVSFNGTNGMSDMEGKAARVAANECGQGVSFNGSNGRARGSKPDTMERHGLTEFNIRCLAQPPWRAKTFGVSQYRRDPFPFPRRPELLVL
jgi:hypothetical protein